MFRDLLPNFSNRLWPTTRRVLILFSAAMAIGAGTVGTGRTFDTPTASATRTDVIRKIAAKPSIRKPITPATKTPSIVHPVELMHDIARASDGARPSLAVPQSMSIVPHQRTVWMEVTAYCACPKCCGPNAQGITASGKSIEYNDGKFVAADTSILPFGTKLVIPGYDEQPVEVIDRGGAIKGNKLDVFFSSHEDALQWGRQWMQVTIVD